MNMTFERMLADGWNSEENLNFLIDYLQNHGGNMPENLSAVATIDMVF